MTTEQKPCDVPIACLSGVRSQRSSAGSGPGPALVSSCLSFLSLIGTDSLSLTPRIPRADLLPPSTSFLPSDAEALHSAYIWDR